MFLLCLVWFSRLGIFSLMILTKVGVQLERRGLLSPLGFESYKGAGSEMQRQFLKNVDAVLPEAGGWWGWLGETSTSSGWRTFKQWASLFQVILRILRRCRDSSPRWLWSHSCGGPAVNRDTFWRGEAMAVWGPHTVGPLTGGPKRLAGLSSQGGCSYL